MSLIKDKKMQWFLHDRFGMFIHFGLYAIPARGEWVRSNERISNEEYQKYFEEFNPVNYNPAEWARLAKEAGMKYAVMTAKHHDGFCLFDSKYTDYKSTNTKCKRDLIREYADAFRAEGLKVGLYYSLIDWHHEHYEVVGDGIHPMRDNAEFVKNAAKRDSSVYIKYLHNQVEELCANYGKIDIMWFDFSYDKKYGEYWDAVKLVRTVRKYQPDIIIDNRLEPQHLSGLQSGNLSEYSGDFVSPEMIIPPEPVRNDKGESLPWEACLTLPVGAWGYNANNRYPSSSVFIRTLVECVSKGGNLLLNVGPNALGEIRVEEQKVLREIGCWMKKNGESVYGCGYADIPKPEYGRVTRNGKKLYYHFFDWPYGGWFDIAGIKSFDEVKSIRRLADNSEIQFGGDAWQTKIFPGKVYVNFCNHPANMPDAANTVIKVELKK